MWAKPQRINQQGHGEGRAAIAGQPKQESNDYAEEQCCHCLFDFCLALHASVYPSKYAKVKARESNLLPNLVAAAAPGEHKANQQQQDGKGTKHNESFHILEFSFGFDLDTNTYLSHDFD